MNEHKKDCVNPAFSLRNKPVNERQKKKLAETAREQRNVNGGHSGQGVSGDSLKTNWENRCALIPSYSWDQSIGQQTRVCPYPLGEGSARPNPKMGAPDPENPLFLGFPVLGGGSRPWSQTMVSEGARPWGRGRSGDFQSGEPTALGDSLRAAPSAVWRSIERTDGPLSWAIPETIWHSQQYRWTALK